MKTILVLALIFSISQSLLQQKNLNSLPDIEQPYTQTQLWYNEQLVDHFAPLDNSVWKQRYWVIDEYFKPDHGPVILFICGEYTCQGVPSARQWPVQLAQMFDGLILVLEHRYYGQSQPFGDQSFKQDNMKLLTVDQALADLAYFLNWVKTTGQHKVTLNNPWVSIGGSYPGAMSAWFRYRYPHLTVGALASSAVINAILNFTEFDQQIRNSALRSGPWCAQAIHDVNFYAQSLLADPQKGDQLKARFNATKLNNGEFLFYFADIFVEQVQYGSRTVLCSMIGNRTKEQVLDIIVKYASDNQVTPYSYGSYYLKNTTYDPSNEGSRQWTYQYCTQFGWLQTAPDVDNSMRGTWVDLDMYKKFCADSFSPNVWPKVSDTNLYFGALRQETTNIMFSNGGEDPWQWASLLQSREQKIALYINCTDCAHCVDLYTPKDTDSPLLKDARKKEVYYFTKWFQNHWTSLGSDIKITPNFPEYQSLNDKIVTHETEILEEKGFAKIKQVLNSFLQKFE